MVGFFLSFLNLCDAKKSVPSLSGNSISFSSVNLFCKTLNLLLVDVIEFVLKDVYGVLFVFSKPLVANYFPLN